MTLKAREDVLLEKAEREESPGDSLSLIEVGVQYQYFHAAYSVFGMAIRLLQLP